MRSLSNLMRVVEGLHFQKDRSDLIRGITPAKWTKLLRLTDTAQLTLPLALRRRDCLPAEVQARVDRNLARNAQRAIGTRQSYDAVAHALNRKGIDFLVLKGMTHYPFYCDDPAHRPQFDLDLYCQPESVKGAAEAVAGLGYEAVQSGRGVAADHIPAMIRKTGFIWRGDYYDPDLPLVIEIHFRFWNPAREAFPVSGDDGFWQRRTRRHIAGCEVRALDPIDDLAYTTWHLVKHLVRGNLRPYHVYELAHFLDRTASAGSFWENWRADAAGVRIAEPVAFRLAQEWFGCRVHPAAQEEIDRLPAAVDRWFRLFALSPLLGMEIPNKDELFLHLALARGPVNRLRITTQKLFPVNLPRNVKDAHVKRVKADGAAIRGRRLLFRARFLIKRARHHSRTWGPILQSSVRWWRASWPAA